MCGDGTIQTERFFPKCGGGTCVSMNFSHLLTVMVLHKIALFATANILILCVFLLYDWCIVICKYYSHLFT